MFRESLHRPFSSGHAWLIALMTVSLEKTETVPAGLPSFPAGKTAHLIGACGAGMTALAELLTDRGWELTGSDVNAAECRNSVLKSLFAAHEAGNLSLNTNLAVYSPAVPETNPERQAAVERAVSQCSYNEFVGELMRDRIGVCIAGTHGKTTTTGMVATILRETHQASALIGGRLTQVERSGWSGSGPHLVVEACEYRRHFLHYRPTLAAILNIEPDHFDCFPTLDDAGRAFVDFARLVRRDGLLLVSAECPFLDEIRSACPANVQTFQSDWRSCPGPRAIDWTVSDVEPAGTGHEFDVNRQGKRLLTLSLSVPGEHNIGNALAAAALAHAAGAGPEQIADSLGRFLGVARRMQVYPDWNGVTLIDDYAHHPTAVEATLRTIRQMFPNRRIVCAYQAHQVSRIQTLRDEFAAAFHAVDQVLLTPVFAAREQTEVAEAERVHLARLMEARGVPVTLLPSLDHLLATIEHAAQPGEVWITMGAGNIDSVLHRLRSRGRLETDG